MTTDSNKSSHVAKLIFLAVSLSLLGVIVVFEGGLVDDAYIFCRYADNIASGYGAVFNIGQKVEGFTSPVFTYLTAIGVWLGIEAVDMVRVLSTLFAVGVVFLLVFSKGTSNDSQLTYPFAALLTVSTVPFGLWASTGMDTTLFALAFTATVVFLDRRLVVHKENRIPLSPLAWLLAGSVVWIRPEGLILVAVMFLLSARRLWAKRNLARTWISLVAASVPFVGLTAFRLAYFDSWLPNTYYAKMSGGGAHLWQKGILYLFNSSILLLPVLICSIVFLIATLRKGTKLSCVYWFILALACGIVVEGGDFFPMFRFVVPLIPLLAIVAVRGIEKVFATRFMRVSAVVLVSLINCAWGMNSPSFSNPNMMSNLESFRAEVRYTSLFSEVGQSLRENLGPDHSIGLLTIGAIPYRTGWRTVDMLGLTDKWIAKKQMSLGTGLVGHEKFDSDYFLDRKPNLILLHPWFWKKKAEPGKVISSPYVHGAQKDLLNSERFKREYGMHWIDSGRGYIALFIRHNQ